MYLRVAILMLMVSPALLAQAAAEAAAGAARATTTAVPADKISKSLNGAFDKIGRAVEDSAKAKPTSSTTPARPARAATPATSKPAPVEPPAAPKPAVSYEDPTGIRAGMEYGEVIRRFGEPSLKLTGDQNQETLCYTKDALQVDVTVRDGKVTEVRKSGGERP